MAEQKKKGLKLFGGGKGSLNSVLPGAPNTIKAFREGLTFIGGKKK